MGVRVGVANLFLDQSIGIDDSNTFHIHFLSSMQILGVTGFADGGRLSGRGKLFFRSIDRY